MLNFEWWYLLSLLPLPWLLARGPLSRKDSPSEISGLRVPFYALAVAAKASRPDAPEDGDRLRTARAWLFWTTLVVALTRPQWAGDAVPITEQARNLLLAVDISPSMLEEDLLLEERRRTRLDVVRHVVGEFIARREGDRLGLILFGAAPYVQAPLTHDLATVGRLLDEAVIGMAGNATAIGDAIGLAIKRLQDQPAGARVLVLLTDGANTGGEVDPDAAARVAAEQDVRIHTIGVGAERATRRSLLGYQTYNPSAELDEDLLQRLAEHTGGRYFRARSTGELEMVYAALDELEPAGQVEQYYRPVTELYWVPAALAGLLLCWMLFDRTGWPRRKDDLAMGPAGFADAELIRSWQDSIRGTNRKTGNEERARKEQIAPGDGRHGR